MDLICMLKNDHKGRLGKKTKENQINKEKTQLNPQKRQK